MNVKFQWLCLALITVGLVWGTTAATQAQEKTQAKQEPEKETDKPASISLAGDWVVKSGERAGAEVDAERFPEGIQIDKNTITIPTPGGDFVMTYKIVSGESPYHVDMTIKEGPGEGNALGIVKMENGTASLCYDPTGTNRPKEFDTNEENGFFMFTMKKKATKVDPEKIVGDWQITSGTKAGEEVTEDRLAAVISFTKEEITIPLGPDMAFKMSYKLNSENNPATIDMTIEEGPGGGGSALGIVKMEDGKFFLCYDSTGQNRPESFESTADNGFFLFEMEPVVD